jgi:hypothetical protein
MVGWLFGKRKPDTHGFWLARICNDFMGTVLGRDGLTRDSGLRCAALSVGVINEMVMNSPLDRAKWDSVRPALENYLVDSLEANLQAIGTSVPEYERNTLAASLREQVNDACNHVLTLSQQAQRLEGKADSEQLIAAFLRQQMVYISPGLSSAQQDNLQHAFAATYMQKLQQPASTYLKKHFASAGRR